MKSDNTTPPLIPLVLLHGFCEDHSVWSPVTSQLQDCQPLFPDMPGFGAANLPASADMSAYAEAVLAELDQAKIARCVLVGHSMGGYAALEFAARWPERLIGLGLVHSHPFEDSKDRKAIRLRGIETLNAGKRDLYVSQLFPGLFTPAFIDKNPEVLHTLISNGKKQRAAGIIAALQAMMTRRDHQQTLANVNCPVLFLLGAQDALVPVEQGLKAAIIPAVADLHLLPEVAHMAMYECPETAAAIINTFYQHCLNRK